MFPLKPVHVAPDSLYYTEGLLMCIFPPLGCRLLKTGIVYSLSTGMVGAQKSVCLTWMEPVFWKRSPFFHVYLESYHFQNAHHDCYCPWWSLCNHLMSLYDMKLSHMAEHEFILHLYFPGPNNSTYKINLRKSKHGQNKFKTVKLSILLFSLQ